MAPFYFWGEKDEAHCKQIPKTDKLLNSIPGFLSAGLSILNANTTIKTHIGDTDAVIRVHLGLKIPEGLPACGIKVGSVEQEWQEGKTFAFCDAHHHSAWNNSNENRYVLILDVLRPELLIKKHEVVRNVKSLMKLQQLDLKYPILTKCPGFFRGVVRKLFT
jgi:aspartyl/asparaginyl beta-hydroxylase (cupin superfamily)